LFKLALASLCVESSKPKASAGFKMKIAKGHAAQRLLAQMPHTTRNHIRQRSAADVSGTIQTLLGFGARGTGE
jgi:hypothetical protein